ncbi:GH3 domain-containing protein-like isoform X2 [Tubulanus polymorphus]
MLRAGQCFGRIIRTKLDKKTTNFIAVQNELLMSRIKLNQDTVYGRDYDFKNMHSKEDYVRLHPLTEYDHYKSYIDRIEKGEENVLTAENPVQLSVTSGTSGSSKVLPMVKSQRKLFFVEGVAMMYSSLLKQFPGCRNLQKSLKIFYTPRWRKSEGGLLIGPNSSSPTNSKHLLNLYTTPKYGFEILTEPEALYVHLLFALADREVGMIEGNFVSLIYQMFVALKTHYRQIIEDIKLGRVDPKLEIDPEIRNQLNGVLPTDPKRAAELENEFEKGFDGIAKRIWPDLNIILAVNTGAFDLYGKALTDETCKDVPIYSPIYAATEGLVGLNIWPESALTKYLLVPSAMFFEFIPIDDSDKPQPGTLFMEQVELKATYELVITNTSGLCRYRFGDVVKIVDFYNGCPVVEFQYRRGQMLNVRAEKTSEETFYKALTSAVDKWNNKLVDYCCAESIAVNTALGNASEEIAPFYTTFIEISGEGNKILTEEQKNQIDDELQKISYVYCSFRNKGSISAMRVHQVKQGTFLQLRTYMLKTTQASANQYKVPRVLKRSEPIQFLMNCVI